MDNMILTITERLKDLRKDRNLTLETLAEATNISRSALGTYEAGEFKDISPFSIVKLAKFYGVTTDYLMGISNLEKEADAEIQELRLTNEALNVLKSGHFSGKVLSEVICHDDFPRLMTDMEIFVDQIASMQVENLNYGIGTARSIVQKQYHPDDNELFYRTAELGKVSADEYVSSVLRDDLTGILRDICVRLSAAGQPTDLRDRSGHDQQGYRAAGSPGRHPCPAGGQQRDWRVHRRLAAGHHVRRRPWAESDRPKIKRGTGFMPHDLAYQRSRQDWQRKSQRRKVPSRSCGMRFPAPRVSSPRPNATRTLRS